MMVKLTALILATCMVGEAGWTIQITNEITSEVVREETDIYYETEKSEETYVESDSEYLYLGTHTVTGYTWTGNTMANGVYPSYGWCACNGLDLGTEVYIDGLGYFIVGDRGGMTDPYWVDIYFDTVEECYSVTGTYDIYVVRK